MGNPSPLFSFLGSRSQRKKQQGSSTLESNLAVEGDARLVRSLLGSLATGAGMVAFLASLHLPGLVPNPVIPTVLLPKKPDTSTVVIVLPPRDMKFRDKIIKRPRPNHTGHPAPSAKPKEPAGILVAKEITSHVNALGKTAYSILGKAMRDLPKLDRVAVIRRNGKQRFSGRPGKLSTEFNPEYDIKDGNGKWDMTDNGSGVSRMPTATTPSMHIPKTPTGAMSEHSISQSQENGWRSTASILAVVKSHSPGLRHLYNRHLRTHPGLQGKVSVRFGIDARGYVVSAAIEGTTTGDVEFDQAILQAIRTWRFEPVRHLGVEEVSVPLQFSE